MIVPIYNGAQTIDAQISALEAQQQAPDFEVILVDNGSTDNTLDLLRARRIANSNLRIVSATDESGASYARNVGVGHAASRHLMFCDADDIVSETWVAQGWRNFEVVDAWSGPCDALESCEFDKGREAVLRMIHDSPRWEPPFIRKEMPSPTLQGGNFGMSKAAFLALGGFDQSLPASFEDLDLAYRAREHGIEIRFAPTTRIAYRRRSTARSIATRQVRMARGHTLVACRHDAWASLPYPSWGTAILRLIGAVVRMPFRRARRRDWEGLRGRALFTYGLTSGVFQYRYLHLRPSVRLGVGLTGGTELR